MRLQSFAKAATAICALGLGLAPAISQARPVFDTVIELDLRNATTDSVVDLYDGKGGRKLTSATTIQDRAFTRLDLRIIMDENTENVVRKMVDQGFTDEPSGCEPGAYGPLDMEDGLRYFFNTNLQTNTKNPFFEAVSVTIYPGNRSLHWANDVSCEYDESAGDDVAVLRVVGHFYVIHRRRETGTDIQLRPIELTPDEFDSLPLQPPTLGE